MAEEAEKLLHQILDRVHRQARLRLGLALLTLALLLGVAGNFLYQLAPRHTTLTISGGDILGNRHLLTRILQDELRPKGIDLKIDPIVNTTDVLEKLESGALDLAFVPAGIGGDYPNIRHVATIAPELLHFLVRPAIRSIGDIRGRTVNLGGRQGSTRAIARAVFNFSGLHDGIDYIETNFSNEQLLSMRDNRLPDVIVIASFVPSFVVDDLVRRHQYRLLEIPFPESLAVRVGWVADAKILAYMYSVVPPVPSRDITTIGVNIHLLANKDVDAHVLYELLETLYSPAVETRSRLKNDESRLTIPSGFRLSAGTREFLARRDPLLSVKTYEKLKNTLGLVMSVLSSLLLSVKWFRGQQTDSHADDDARLAAYLRRLCDIDQDAAASAADAGALLARLDALKADLVTALPGLRPSRSELPGQLLHLLTDSRLRLLGMAE